MCARIGLWEKAKSEKSKKKVNNLTFFTSLRCDPLLEIICIQVKQLMIAAWDTSGRCYSSLVPTFWN